MSGRVQGKIISVTPQGNLVSDINREQLLDAPRDERLVVRCDEHQTNGLFASGHKQPPFTLIALLTDNGRLELEIVEDNAQLMLGISLGEMIEVTWT